MFSKDCCHILNKQFGGTWVVQAVEHPTLDFGSIHEMVCEFEPRIRLCANSTEPAWNSPPPSLSAPPLLSLSFSQK